MSTKYTLVSTDNLNDIVEPGVYSYMQSINRPRADYGQLLVCFGVGYCFQIVFERILSNISYAYYRSCNDIQTKNWSEWTELITNRSSSFIRASSLNNRYYYAHFTDGACLVWDKETGKVYIQGTTTGGTSVFREL